MPFCRVGVTALTYSVSTNKVLLKLVVLRLLVIHMILLADDSGSFKLNHDEKWLKSVQNLQLAERMY